MNRVIEWKNIVDETNGIITRKNNVRLYLDCIYKNKTYAQNYSYVSGYWQPRWI